MVKKTLLLTLPLLLATPPSQAFFCLLDKNRNHHPPRTAGTRAALPAPRFTGRPTSPPPVESPPVDGYLGRKAPRRLEPVDGPSWRPRNR